MGDLISLNSKKPHLSGRALCLSCKHEWEAVAPAGTKELECPNCHTEHGRFMYPIVREELHWNCNCGNDLFHITPTYCYCPVCGVTCQFP